MKFSRYTVVDPIMILGFLPQHHNDIRVKSTSCHFGIHDIVLPSKLKHYIMYPKRC